MKIKISGLIILGALLLGACASAAPETADAAPAVEAATAPAVEQPAQESMDASEGTAAAPGDAAATVSFSMDVWPILEKYALAAHGGKGGVFLESYDDILKYVTPGDPENSMLYKALIGDGMKRMPPDAPLPDEMIQTIYDWIKQGALNN
ncbi:MAG: hypothetical protein HPY72_06225 [Anaerolineae bacterium]|nr:hypothetical protein [Anaerolineae bacterium]